MDSKARQELNKWLAKEFPPTGWGGQVVLADLLGTTEATVSRIVTGVSRPGLELGVMIEEVTKIPAGWWLQAPRPKKIEAPK